MPLAGWRGKFFNTNNPRQEEMLATKNTKGNEGPEDFFSTRRNTLRV
jgi:hypothetical protein